jgi:hypothetical protein
MTAFSRMEESYWWDGLNCYDNYNAYTVGETDPMSVVPTLSVGTVSVSPSVISSTQDATLNITLAVSSGAVNTNGTTLEVGIANATGTFQLTFTPSSQSVNLAGGQSQTSSFNVHVASVPSVNRTCHLTAHVNATASSLMV